MIRISEIIKMGDGDGPDKEKHVSMKESSAADIPKLVNYTESKRMVAHELYGKGLTLMEDAIARIKREEAIDNRPILNFVKELVENILVDENEQFNCFYKVVPPIVYLHSHSLNVGLLSAKMGTWTGLNKSELIDLASAGLLHDVGMAKVEDITLKDGVLSKEERTRVKKHAEYSVSILRKMNCLTNKALLAVRSHHNRGPRDRLTQIIGLSDIYEAMTHPRVYRKAKLPHQAIAEIVNNEAGNFHPEVIKVLVNNVGIYPIGSMVKLSNGESGMVIGVNKDYPLRPRVNILFDRSGERLKETNILDLTTEPHLYIDGPLDLSSSSEADTDLG